MDQAQAKRTVIETFTREFDRERFLRFVKNLLNHPDDSRERRFRQAGPYIKKAFQERIRSFERLATYTDPSGQKLDVLVINLQSNTALERARTFQRNFVADYLATGHGRGKEAVLAAFVSENLNDWRFSFIKLEYSLEETQLGFVIEKKELTPARRYSFLVGSNEKSHTAQKQFLDLLENDLSDPFLKDIEKAFDIEKVTKEFFERYKELFETLRSELGRLVESKRTVRQEFSTKAIELDDFAKKLLGQIVFLYFLQKKGWFGVDRDAEWGSGKKDFLRHLFVNRLEFAAKNGKADKNSNFFNDILEPLFYEALAIERSEDFYSRFHCKIPFLNGGLFEPLQGYNWVNVDIPLPDELFSNKEPSDEGSTGTGILDVLDRYNFTVNEAEPLEKEVAVDPEMLGKVFENLLPENQRRKGGTYYTPRIIVHYMCQQSLINYLVSGLSDLAIARKDIETFIHVGERYADFESTPRAEEINLLPESIRQYAPRIDELLETVLVCDPAIGSGAFPVGMMQEIVRARLTVAGVPGMPKLKTYQLKRQAIQHSLYGVDIDPGTVEIAKLRLWLSLVVDEDDIRKIEPLPNLDYKIMQGNSLLDEFEGVKLLDEHLFTTVRGVLESQLYELSKDKKKLSDELIRLRQEGLRASAKARSLDKQIEQLDKRREVLLRQLRKPIAQFDMYSESQQKLELLKKLHEDFFNVTSAREKGRLRERLDALEWEFMETKLRELDNTKALKELQELRHAKRKPFFLWKLQFVEVFQSKSGFDIVIANPPYISALEFASTYPESLRIALNRCYSSAKGTYDLYVLFIELGIKLLHKQGNLCLINPNKFLSARYGMAVRQFILDNASLHRIVDVSGIEVFDNVAVYPVLLFLSPPLEHSDQARLIDLVLPIERHMDEFDISKFSVSSVNRDTLTLLPENIWGFLLSNQIDLLSRLTKDCIRLSEFGEINATSTAGEAAQYSEFLTAHRSRDSLKIINTGTIDRYRSLWGKEPMTNAGEKFLKPYISLSKAKVNERRQRMYKSPKVLFAKMARTCEAYLDGAGEFASVNTNCFYEPKSVTLHYVTAFCNSKLFMFLYDQFFGALRMGGGYYQFQAPQLRVMPVRNPPVDQLPYVILVEYVSFLTSILDDNNSRDQLMVSYFEQIIDAMIYEVFLSEELHKADKTFLGPLRQENLPRIDEIEGQKVPVLRDIFERLFDRNHVIRKNLFFLDTLESVRIIEGKA